MIQAIMICKIVLAFVSIQIVNVDVSWNSLMSSCWERYFAFLRLSLSSSIRFAIRIRNKRLLSLNMSWSAMSLIEIDSIPDIRSQSTKCNQRKSLLRSKTSLHLWSLTVILSNSSSNLSLTKQSHQRRSYFVRANIVCWEDLISLSNLKLKVSSSQWLC